MAEAPSPDLASLDDASGERASVGVTLLGSVVSGRYRVLSRLQSGGMADVYEVEQVELGRRFALKVLRRELCENASVVGRFARESRSVSTLVSEHIVSIVDVGTTEQGAPYFVMERLYGQDLRRLLERDGALGVPRALHLGLGVCRALSVAHAAGIVHRDLKPENLFVVRADDGSERAKVLDFGVAKLSGENPTLPGTLVGTARYMAPEQITGDAEKLGPATDLFALGAILFECLAGRPAFEADTLERVLFKIVSEPAPSLLVLRPELPTAVAQLVDFMLQKDPAARPQSAAEVSRVLAALTAGPASGATLSDATLVAPLMITPRRTPNGLRRWVTLLAVFGAGLGLGALLGARPTMPSGATPSVASQEPRISAPKPVESTVEPASASASAERQITTAVPAVGRAVPRATSSSAAPSSVAPPSKPPLFFPSESP